MAGLDDLLGLGGQIPEEAAPTPAAGGWSAFLNKPENQAGLLSMAAAMLQPQWGGTAGAVAQGLGAFGEARGKSAEAQLQQMNQEEGRKLTQSEGAANRASHEKVAQITADSRTAAAEIRADASIQRATMALQKAPPGIGAKYLDLARKAVNDTLGNVTIDDLTRTSLIQSKAAQLYDAAVQMGLEKGGGPFGASGSGTPGASPAGPGGTGPTGAAPSATSGTPILDKAMTDPANGAQLQKDLGNPTARKKIYDNARNPAFKRELEMKYPDLAPSGGGAPSGPAKSYAPSNLIRRLFGYPETDTSGQEIK